MADETEVLRPERFIKTKLGAEGGDGVGRSELAKGGDSGVARHHPQRQEYQGQHQENGRDDLQTAAQDISGHA